MMRRFVQVAMFAALAFSCCKAARAQMVLYDDFSGTVINPAKWTGGTSCISQERSFAVPDD
jgi:hypothetical protein